MLEHPFDDPIIPVLLSPTTDDSTADPPVVPAAVRKNFMAGDVVEVARASANGRVWMSHVGTVHAVLVRGERAILLSDPVRSEGSIWVKVRRVDDPAGEPVFVLARLLDLVEAVSDAPLTIPREIDEAPTGPYRRGDIVHTRVAVNLRSQPGIDGTVIAKLPSHSLATIGQETRRTGDTDWVEVSSRAGNGWLAVKHTELFAREQRWLEVDLDSQSLIGWDGANAAFRLTVSTGKPGFRTPQGTFTIGNKYPARRTTATVNGEHWDIPGVPWIMVFRHGGYYFHGVYWHDDFGTAVSHGCVTLAVPDAERLYDWTPSGTPVWIHA